MVVSFIKQPLRTRDPWSHSWGDHPVAFTPRQALAWSTRIALGAAPLAALILAGWVLHIVPDTHLVLAAYLTLLLVAVCAGCVAMLSNCQLALHKAFVAGYHTGIASVRPNGEDSRRDGDPVLRLVE